MKKILAIGLGFTLCLAFILALAGVKRRIYNFSLEEVEKLHIKRVLQHAKDYDEAAQILGIDPATLWRKRKKYGF